MVGVRKLERYNNKIKATLWNPYTMADGGERIVDQVVVENGTSPLDDLYFRVGDAIASRNIHAAIYDGLRLAKDF